MNLPNKLILITIVTILSIGACTNLEKEKSANNGFRKSLIAQKVEGTNYVIELPDGYDIIERPGVDFSVYYFSPKDTTNTVAFRGGFYLGNAGAGFGADSGGCEDNKISSVILNEEESWSLYNCDGKFKIETIIDSKSGMNWAQMLHAFGRAESNDDLEKLLEVYSTLKTVDKQHQ